MHANLLHNPYRVLIRNNSNWIELQPNGSGKWQSPGIEVEISEEGQAIGFSLESSSEPIQSIKLRWNGNFRKSGRLMILGDHWERAYGDLEWRGIVPERVMPWYFMTYDGDTTRGYGVKTGANALVYWQMDTEGITLTADVSSGNTGVNLAGRRLNVAQIVTFESNQGETAFAASRRFCAQMCERPLMPAQPVYGGNNWYYAYGNSSHSEILEDSKFISSLSSNALNRPYMVIDDGWQLCSGGGACNGGPWEGNSLFHDMPGLAAQMKEIGVKPGIWCRLLLTSEQVPSDWARYSTPGGTILDPSVPDVLEYVKDSVKRMASWGYELIKHDFSTFDILGEWGFKMKSRPHVLPYAFKDGSKTTAEIILDLYRAIKEASGSSYLIGCNTVSHLAAGLVEIQRTGDDTSGKCWERTRYMGINTLAFRMMQHGTFYSHDADCIGITENVPWEMNQHWLDLLAGSGTPLFVSAHPSKVTEAQTIKIRNAFELAAQNLPAAEPLNWMETTCPSIWLLNGKEHVFDWNRLSPEQLGKDDNCWWR